MATNAFENLSIPAHDTAADLPELLIAQAEPSAPPPQPAPVKTVVEVAADLTLTLPPDATIDQPRANGTDLEFVQPDGSVIVVPNGAVTGLVIVIGDTTIPAEAVATIFASNNIETAAGPEGAAAALQSSGGNFATPVPGIGEGFALIDLLPPTDFGLPGTELEELLDAGLRRAATARPDSNPLVRSLDNATVDEDGFTTANLDKVPLAGNETNSTESLTDTQTIVIDYKNAADVPGTLDGSLVLLDTPALDGKLTTLSGNPVNFALDGSGQLVGRDSVTNSEVIRIAILTGASLLGTEVTYSYQVTLSQPVKHTDDETENSAILPGVTFRATDSDGDPIEGAITVNVVDDVPAIEEIKNAILANTTGIVSGGVDVTYGADGPAIKGLIIEGWTDLAGIVEVRSADKTTLTAYIDANNSGTYDLGEEQFYQLTVDSDTNTYTLSYTERPVVSVPLVFPGDTGGAGVETITVAAGAQTVKFDGGRYDGTSLVNLGPGNTNDDLKPTGNGFGIGGDPSINNNDGFFATILDAGSPSVADSFSFSLSRQGGGSGTPQVTLNWQAYDIDGNPIVGGSGFNAGANSVVVPLTVNQTAYPVTIDPPGEFHEIRVWFTGVTAANSVGISGVAIGMTVIPEDQPLSFDIAAVDGDGDVTATHQLDVLLQGGAGPSYTLASDDSDSVLQGGAGNDFLTGGDGDDILIGGEGIDEMTGGAGKDTFVIDVESLLPGFDDVIIDFTPTGTGDVLDLSDLLPGITTATNLATGGYVSLDSNGTDTAVFVDANGGGDNYQQVAVLKSVGTSLDITILLDDGTTTVTTI